MLALEPPAPRLRSELAGRFGVDVSIDEASSAIAAEIAYYRAHLDQGRDRASLAALRRRCAEVVRDALPALADVDGDALTEALLASLRFRVFDDVVPALRSLRARSITLVVVSNWDVSLHDLLARLELRPLLDGILTSAEAGVRKPDAGDLPACAGAGGRGGRRCGARRGQRGGGRRGGAGGRDRARADQARGERARAMTRLP